MTDPGTTALERPESLDPDDAPAPATPGTAPAAARRSEEPSVGQALRQVYRFLHTKKVGLLLILAMSILTLLGVLFPQAPLEVRTNPDWMADWVADLRPRYGGWAPVLETLGIFTMFSSWLFKVVSALLAASIIACTTHRMPLLWRQATRPHLHVTEGFFRHSRLNAAVAVPRPPEEVSTQMRAGLAARRFRVLDDPRGPGLNSYADRNRFAPLGTVLAHAAFVTIMFGALVSANTGFRISDFAVPVGDRVAVGHGTDLEVEVLQFADTYHADGRPKDYVSEVVLWDGGQKITQQEVRVNSPLRHDGVKINQSYFGPAASLTISKDGRKVYDGGVPLDWTTDDDLYTYGKFAVPGEPLLLYVVTPASGQVDAEIGPGQVRLEAYASEADESPLANEVLSQGDPTRIGDYEITFNRELKFTGLMVSRDHGAPWVWAGAVMLAIGTFLTMLLRFHRVWARVEPDGHGGSLVRLACPDRPDIAFENQFRSLVTELDGAPVDTTRK